MSRTTKGPGNAHTRWKVPLLLDTLRRQGWGPLDGKPWKGLRAVLAALGSRVDYHSGQGTATVEQIATAAGYSFRWTRYALQDLEDIGLIVWERGGVQYGRPVPSQFRINKAMLVDLIKAAREKRDAQIIAWAKATRARLERIRTIRMVKGKRKNPPTFLKVPAGAPATAQGFGVVKPKTMTVKRSPSSHVAVAAHPSRWRGTRQGVPPSEKILPPGNALQEAKAQGLSGAALARGVLAGLGLRQQ